MSPIIPIINNQDSAISKIKSSNINFNNEITVVPSIDSTYTNNNNNNNDLILEMNAIGPRGPKGERGLTGNGILRIEKTGSSGLTDYYTIYFTNGETFNYEITNGIIHYYDGDYEVTPMAYTSQILPTENMVMHSDITINEIPYNEVSNLSGGLTATIGD